ncbi:MAG: NAD-binding protein, partial [Phycisphaerae bacterium]|nr:NAD-binding protein [Phycisphaerae bacterium]
HMGSRLWNQWCLVRVCIAHARIRLLVMAAILVVGAVLFMKLESHEFGRSLFYTFALVFGEIPEEFPKSGPLQVVFFLFPVLGLTVIIEGIVDIALVVRDRRRVERRWCQMLASSFRDHVILVGFGRLGFRTYTILRRLDQPVVVIERDANGQFLEELRRDGTPLFIGDARRESLLEDANIKAARSIVIATDDDMANLETALDARRLHPQIRVVLRMFDQDMADKIGDGFDIHLAMSPSALSAPTFATCALAPATVNSFIVGDTLLAMQRWLVRHDGPLGGKTVAEVMREHGVMVVRLERTTGEPNVCPSPDLRLEPGDGVLLQGPVETIERLRSAALSEAAGGSTLA